MFSGSKGKGGSNYGAPSSHSRADSSTSSTVPASIDRAGLVNNGSICYLNSTLQCLATLHGLQIMLPDPTASSASAPFSSPSLQALLDNSYPPELPVTAALASVLRRLWQQRGGTINPKELTRALGKKSEVYADIHEQQDVQEAFSFLTGAICMEEVDLIKKLRPPPPKLEKMRRKRRATMKPARSPNSAANHSSEDDADTSSSSSSSEDDAESPAPTPEASPDPSSEPVLRPFVDTLFGGKLASIVVCEECKHVSIARDPFQDLSVEMAREERPKRRDRIRQFLSKNATPTQPSASPPTRPLPVTRPSQTILSVSDTEASESEGATSGNASTGSKGNAIRRRRSLDPALLRQKKGIFASAKSRDTSPIRSSKKSDSSSSNKPRRPRQPKIPHPTAEQAAYIKRLLADVPGASSSPLAQLRMAQPGGAAATMASSSSHHAHGSTAVIEEQAQTGLYEALRRFTAVEVLEGENAFACRNCWKLLHPHHRKSRSGKLTAKPTVRTPSPLAFRTDGSDDEGGLSPLTGDTEDNEARRGSIASQVSNATSTESVSSASLYATAPRMIPTISTELVDDGVRPGTPPPVSPSQSSVQESSESGYPADEDSGRETAATSYGSDLASSLPNESGFAALTIASNKPSVSLEIPRSVPPAPTPRAQRYILRRAQKRLLIDSLPKALVIHLKRFQQSSRAPIFGSGFRDLKKIDTFVSFPLVLDLAPFLAPKGRKPGEAKEAKGLLPKMPSHHHAWFHWHHTSDKGEAIPTRYKLVGLISHSGSMSSGHYIAYVLAPTTTRANETRRQWIYTSDETMRLASVNEVLACKGYVFFYERNDGAIA